MGAGSVGDLCLDLKEERDGTRRPRGRSLSKTAILLFDNGIFTAVGFNGDCDRNWVSM